MDADHWNNILLTFFDPHILQTWQWGQVKSRYGWNPHYKIWGDSKKPDASALLLERSLSLRRINLPIKIIYVPRGPIIRNWQDESIVSKVLDDLRVFAQQHSALFIKIDPEIPMKISFSGTETQQVNLSEKQAVSLLNTRHWQASTEQIQFRNTILVDLTMDEEEILARMKQKTRYNIRLAERKGVTVRSGSDHDLDLLYRMYAETSMRDGFVIRDPGYYTTVWQTFLNYGKKQDPLRPMCELLIAEVDGSAIAGIVIFRFAGRAYYMHGMSLDVHRNLMPNYLLQWEAIKRSKAAECRVYDLWGAPEVYDESDPMWGVFRFKDGLGGRVLQTIGAYDSPIKPGIYHLYTQLLPRILQVMRKRGFSRTRRRSQEF